MVDYIAKVGSTGNEVAFVERNLLSEAYKHVSGTRLAACCITTRLKEKTKGTEDDAMNAWVNCCTLQRYAKLIEKAECYDQIADYMAKLGGNGLSVLERKLTFGTYKNALLSCRRVWLITSVELKENIKDNNDYASHAKERLRSCGGCAS